MLVSPSGVGTILLILQIRKQVEIDVFNSTEYGSWAPRLGCIPHLNKSIRGLIHFVFSTPRCFRISDVCIGRGPARAFICKHDIKPRKSKGNKKKIKLITWKHNVGLSCDRRHYKVEELVVKQRNNCNYKQVDIYIYSVTIFSVCFICIIKYKELYKLLRKR